MTKNVKICATPRLCDLEFVKEGINQSYIDAVHGSGARIDLMTIDHQRVEEFAKEYDGLLVTGGVDVKPSLYGEERVFGNDSFDYEYDIFDIELIKAFSNLNKPIFGICRGIQIINVAFGGTLYQDIDTFYKNLDGLHKNNLIDNCLSHEVIIEEGTFLCRLLEKKKIMVNSYHHQSIKDLSDQLRVVAKAPDGTIEAVEGKNIIAVQWHPEKIYDIDDQKKIFDYFICMCKGQC